MFIYVFLKKFLGTFGLILRKNVKAQITINNFLNKLSKLQNIIFKNRCFLVFSLSELNNREGFYKCMPEWATEKINSIRIKYIYYIVWRIKYIYYIVWRFENKICP